jgi:ABC-type multidrug transport system ATPase subunit
MDTKIVVTPDTYTPSIDDAGNYIDRIPTIKHGLLCLCGTRKDKRYENTAKFAAHIKTKTHQTWLMTLNQNKLNHYVQALEHKELVENQRKIIGNLEKQLSQKNRMIEYLTEELLSKQVKSIPVVNLLDIN